MSSVYPTPSLRTGGLNICKVVILAKNPGGQFGGYRTRSFISPVEEQCAFCKQIPRDPYHVSCGHLFCQDCLFNYLIILKQPCSQCHAPIRIDDCVSDPQLTKLIADSSIRCPFSEMCQWVGPLSSLSLHFSECTQINPLTRSWMLSIQSHLSNLVGESGRLERRVNRLSELFKKMDGSCEAAAYEYEKRIEWIGNRIHCIQKDLRPPAKELIEPTPVPTFLKPPGSQDYPSLNIGEEAMTESLRYDLDRFPHQTPRENPDSPPRRREFRFSVYEDHVREDTGEEDFAFSIPDEGGIEVFILDDPPYDPNFLNTQESVQCLHCYEMTPASSKHCKTCKRIL